MLEQTLPLGINTSSPITWFVLVVAAIVLALTLSTRRATALPRAASNGARTGPARPNVRASDAGRWLAAQARFVEDPRGGCELARTIVAEVIGDRGPDAREPAGSVQRWQRACAILADEQASTDDLRAAFIDLRAVFDAS